MQEVYYCIAKNGDEISEDRIKLEDFMSYLDIDRHLMLHGGDYSAPERPLKNLIVFVIYKYQRKITENQFILYEKFSERLGPNDIVYTFNYDTILEDVLRRKNIPYRLYPTRYKHDEKINHFHELQRLPNKNHAPPQNIPPLGMQFIYPTLGLVNEAGEVAGKIKKIFRDKDGVIGAAEREALKAELGDVLWYLAQTCTELEISLEEVAESNLTKLLDRQARGKIQGRWGQPISS
jgi:NTP pyrophosphatase (non-canonical NTP hydrolase)